jgi:hypothetical protein
MQFVAVQEITITKQPKLKGSNRVVRNYDLNGVPFGQVWTYKFAGEKHVWHAAKANGELIGNGYSTEAEADIAIRSAM